MDLRPHPRIHLDQRGLPELSVQDGFITVLVAAGSPSEADAIAEALLAEHLAACVQTTGVVSRYVWKGHVERADEVLLFIKTRAALFDAVQKRVMALHSYETPEIIALPILDGARAYLDWIDASTRDAASD